MTGVVTVRLRLRLRLRLGLVPDLLTEVPHPVAGIFHRFARFLRRILHASVCVARDHAQADAFHDVHNGFPLVKMDRLPGLAPPPRASV